MILISSSNDYAGFGHSMGKALRSIGVDCIDTTLSKHPFNYGTESTVVSRETFKTLSAEAEHVLICHSCPILFDLNQNPSFSVAHTGTRLRESPEYFKDLFQSAKVHLTDQTEFMRYGKMKYIVSAVDKSIYKPKEIGKKIIVGHYPSNPEVKGTNEIIEMLKPFRDQFEIRIGLKQVSHEEQIKRMQECDVIVELFKPILNGRRYGCFGVTALEGLMMGKLVVTQDLEDETYRDSYGEHLLVNAKTPHQFKTALDSVQSYFSDSVSKQIHEDAVSRHGYEATGKRLMELLRL
jgi:hypothetical protein